ncbi:hypothetical protein UlMin_004353 [Ulmus minor]
MLFVETWFETLELIFEILNLFYLLSWIALSLGNLATRYAWAFVGLSVTEVVTCSITVVIDRHNLELLLDGKINKAKILFPGVTCFLIVVCLGSAIHSSNAADNKVKLQSLSDDLEDVSGSSTKAKAGTAYFVVELENRRSIKVIFGKSMFIGLGITFFSGVCFSLFSPTFNLFLICFSILHFFFYFSVSCFVIAIILNIIFLYHPILNLPKTTLRAYLNDWNGKGWAFLANLLCGFGNGLQFMGGQALLLVSTFWGILPFGEYRKSSRITYILLVSILSMFIVAVGILMASSGHQKSSSD